MKLIIKGTTSIHFILLLLWQTQLMYHFPLVTRASGPLSLVWIPMSIALGYVLYWLTQNRELVVSTSNHLLSNTSARVGSIVNTLGIILLWYTIGYFDWWHMPTWYWVELLPFYFYTDYVLKHND